MGGASDSAGFSLSVGGCGLAASLSVSVVTKRGSPELLTSLLQSEFMGACLSGLNVHVHEKKMIVCQ